MSSYTQRKISQALNKVLLPDIARIVADYAMPNPESIKDVNKLYRRFNREAHWIKTQSIEMGDYPLPHHWIRVSHEFDKYTRSMFDVQGQLLCEYEIIVEHVREKMLEFYKLARECRLLWKTRKLIDLDIQGCVNSWSTSQAEIKLYKLLKRHFKKYQNLRVTQDYAVSNTKQGRDYLRKIFHDATIVHEKFLEKRRFF